MNIILYVILFCTFVVHSHVLAHFSNLLLTLLTVPTQTVDASTILGFHFFGVATIHFFYLINYKKIRVYYSTASTIQPRPLFGSVLNFLYSKAKIVIL